MIDAVVWLVVHLAGGIGDLATALADPWAWLNWSDRQALARFIYYGGSVEFFFVVLDIALILFVAGLIRRPVLWAAVRAIETFHNVVGRFIGWSILIMAIQQIVIVVLQRIFRVSEIPLGPFGLILTRDISWYSEELRLYNATVVTLACAYTFVQGGHVRVDLIYAGLSHRKKRLMDMIGSLIFVLPLATVIWLYSWFFMWRHLVTPPVAAADRLESLLRKARIMKWNVETIGFSPNGFDGYFLFKILMVAFAGMLFLQGLNYFYRSYLEYVEGEAAADKYVDHDPPGDAAAEHGLHH
ncbi:MAG TPA: TRAP transporter small permease subunit [Paracoccaceae bacterium]|nr:TRAP transporter small permease subunit [Paracoccaceae bacterium]